MFGGRPISLSFIFTPATGRVAGQPLHNSNVQNTRSSWSSHWYSGASLYRVNVSSVNVKMCRVQSYVTILQLSWSKRQVIRKSWLNLLLRITCILRIIINSGCSDNFQSLTCPPSISKTTHGFSSPHWPILCGPSYSQASTSEVGLLLPSDSPGRITLALTARVKGTPQTSRPSGLLNELVGPLFPVSGLEVSHNPGQKEPQKQSSWSKIVTEAT